MAEPTFDYHHIKLYTLPPLHWFQYDEQNQLFHKLDGSNIVRYIQIGKELTDQLDYVDVLKNLNTIVQAGPLSDNESLLGKCKSCEVGALSLPIDIIKNRLRSFPDWQLVDDKKIVKEIKFLDFITAKYFLDLLSIIAEEQGHHPTFTLVYNKLKIILTTHSTGGLTENDFIMAQIINELEV